jgi:hypothetical protein
MNDWGNEGSIPDRTQNMIDTVKAFRAEGDPIDCAGMEGRIAGNLLRPTSFIPRRRPRTNLLHSLVSAVRCLQDARITVDPRHKTFLVEMAQAWHRLAERETLGRNDYASVSELDRGD